jgi:hypothetical protein
MEVYRARLIATDRPPPFRLENLGSWGRLDDGDASVNARHATLSGQALQRRRRWAAEAPQRRSGITGPHSVTVMRRKLAPDREISSARSAPGPQRRSATVSATSIHARERSGHRRCNQRSPSPTGWVDEPRRPGERRQVTTLFTNLKGSSDLLADRDHEEARDS